MKVLFAFAATTCLFCAVRQTPTETPPSPLETPPLEYFANHCARCHGENGFNFLPEFAKPRTDDALRKSIREMAEGPGQAPLEKEDVDVQLAFHRAISEKAPFAAWTQQKGTSISGELLPETELSATPALDIKIKDGTWSIELPEDTKPSQVTIIATRGKKTAALPLGKRAFSLPEEPAGDPDTELARAEARSSPMKRNQ